VKRSGLHAALQLAVEELRKAHKHLDAAQIIRDFLGRKRRISKFSMRRMRGKPKKSVRVRSAVPPQTATRRHGQ